MSAAAVEVELCPHVCPLVTVRKRKSASDLITSVTPKEPCSGLAPGVPVLNCLTLSVNTASTVDFQSNDLNNNDQQIATVAGQYSFHQS